MAEAVICTTIVLAVCGVALGYLCWVVSDVVGEEDEEE